MPRTIIKEVKLEDLGKHIFDTLNQHLRPQIDTYWEEYQKELPKDIESASIIIQTIARRNAPVDTGTMRKRIDYKIVGWHTAYIGVFEPHMRRFYTEAHTPTNVPSRYTGEVVPEFRINPQTGRSVGHRYAWVVERNQPFLNHVVKEQFAKRMLIGMGRFNKKHFNL